MLYCAIEGLKGSGKSTLITGLRERLHANGVAFQVVNPTHAGHRLHLWEVLRRLPLMGELDWVAECVYAYRSNHHASRIRWQQGDLLLGDRSFLTTLVTRWHRTGSMTQDAYLNDCRKKEWLIPMPDHVIYLDAPPEQLQSRLLARERTYGRHDESLERLSVARQAYLRLMESPPSLLEQVRWHRLDAMQSPVDLLENTWATIQSIIKEQSS